MLHKFLRISSSSKISLVGTAEGTGSGNSFSVSYPVGTQNNDVAFICISTESNMSTGYSATGWTSLNANTSQNNVKSNLLYRVVSGTGTQSFSKGGLSPSNIAYILVVFRNCSYSSFSVATGSSGTPNPPSRTGTFNSVIVFGNSEISDSAVTPPTGYTTLGEINNSKTTTMGGYIIGSTTNPDPSAFTDIASGEWTAYTIGLT